MSQNLVYALILLLSSVLSTFLFYFANRRRPKLGATELTIFCALQVWWSFTYALYWLNWKSPSSQFLLNLTYIGVVGSPAAFFAFCAVFTRRIPWLIPGRAYLLLIMPVLTLTFLFTDSYHHLFYGANHTETDSVIYTGGIWFWMNAIYSYVLILFSIYFLVYAFLKAGNLHKKQIGILILGALVPIIASLVGLLKISPVPDLDLIPISFTITCLVYSYGFFWYRILDILPIARNVVIENIPDGVLVLDKENRILDINPSARELLQIPRFEARGQPASHVLPKWDSIAQAVNNSSNEKLFYQLRAEPDCIVELKVTPLFDKREETLIGHVLVMRDQTERIHFENRLKQANLDLHQKLAEIADLQKLLRDQAIRDSLTGLFNRRFLDETLNLEIAHAQRTGNPISVIFGDVDDFKWINDTYGHQVGDEVLRHIAQMIMAGVRIGDVACRMGGDEFVLILPNTPLPVAMERARELCTKIASEPYTTADRTISHTISLGVVCYPEHGKTGAEIMYGVDQALYQSKKSGRNQISVFNPGQESNS